MLHSPKQPFDSKDEARQREKDPVTKWTTRSKETCITYAIPEFHVGGKVLVTHHTRDMLDPKNYLAYHVVHVKGWQLELMEESGKTSKVVVQDVKVTNPVNELVKNSLDETAFVHPTRYKAQSKLMEDLNVL